MTLLVTVETGEMAQVLASRTGYIGGMDTDGWGGVFPSLFGGFIPMISSRRGLGFGTLEGIASRIPSGGGLGLGHDSVSGAIISE